MADETTISKHSVEGGIARSKAMTATQRSESARRAAEARWAASVNRSAPKTNKTIAVLPRETHEGVLNIGLAQVPCSVLDNNVRVFSIRGISRAMGYKRTGTFGSLRTGAPQLPGFLAASNLKPFISEALSVRLISPIQYRPKHAGNAALGYEATLLPEICEVLLDARKAGVLRATQEILATTAETFIRGFARVGVIALIDEATGFQYDRPKRDLEEYLSNFLSETLRRWVRSFPNDYFKHLCRLKNVVLRPDMKLPQYFGHLTNDLIYRRIAPGLLRAIKERRSERGLKSNKLHWWASEELGRPELLLHLGTVVGLMKTQTNYDAFYKQLNSIAPIYPDHPTLWDDPKDWEA